MANRNFNKKQALEKEVKELHLEFTPPLFEVSSDAVLDLSTDITLSNASPQMGERNGTTFELVVNAPAGNDDDEVLITFTGTAAAIVCTVTPNDGSNNFLTPVSVDEDELAEVILSGAIFGKNAVVTDASNLRTLQTAVGGANADALTSADDQVVTFADGVTEVDLAWSGLGIASVIQDNTGEYTVNLQDAYNALKSVQACIVDADEQDIMWQVKSEDVVDDKQLILYSLTGASPADVPHTSKVLVKIELKNSSVG